MEGKVRNKWYRDNEELFNETITQTIEKDYPVLYVAEFLQQQGNPFALKTIQKHIKDEIIRRLP
ncbi:hypothetical protein [uncultured phage MedDCM-OCT-S08-C495]|nr:hypothetical protein [uncultured phage MedDCM-OCT-S08-C495]